MARGKRRAPRAPRRTGEADPSALSTAGVPELSTQALVLALAERNLAVGGSRQAREARLTAALSNSSPTTGPSSTARPTPGSSSSSADPTSPNDLSAVLDELATLREQVNHLSGTAPPSRRTTTAAPAEAEAGPVDTTERSLHHGRLPQPTGPCAGAGEDLTVVEGEVPRACVHLSHALLLKISRAEFVDLSALLPSRTAFGQEASSARLRLVPDGEGGDSIVVTSTATPRRRVDNLASWLEAWSVYAAARIHASPRLAPQLLAYQSFISTAVQRYPVPAVLAYDASFRQLIAQDPTMRWDKRDVDLDVQVFTGSWSHAQPAVRGDRPPSRRGGGVEPHTPSPAARFTRTAEGEPICWSSSIRPTHFWGG